ncbi:MAG TPA: class I SAM-dependent methyltransferase [Phototrophicaceae bacterium]|nr:class I SAM-dependent methyltransferase [Phototrophicaceae bacterium]
MNNPSNPASTPVSSPTAQATPDSLGLGHSSGQRGAEILAGFRAEKYPSPDTIALSRWSGRIVARLLMRLAASEAPVNYPTSRFMIFENLIRRVLQQRSGDFILAEVASGLSPRGLRLAREFPQLHVIEVDLPSVVQDKQQRLRAAKNLRIPANIEWRGVDLGVVPLSDVLTEQLDIVSAEGLFGYFAPDEVIRIAANICKLLKPGGRLISDITWKPGFEEAKQVTSFFTRQAGEVKTLISSYDEGQKLFQEAGYETANFYQASKLIAEFKLPHPVVDIGVTVEAIKGSAKPEGAVSTPASPEPSVPKP